MAEEGQQVTDGQQQSQNGTDWRPHAESLRSDPELAPHLDKISEKSITDLVKSHVHLSRKLGNTFARPDPAKPEEVKSFLDSVKKAGFIESAPESPDKYTINRPQGMDERAWSDQIVNEFRGVAHELGLTQKQVEKLAEFDAKRFNSFVAPLAQDMEAAKKTVSEQWAKEGKAYDDMMALAVDGMAKRGFTPEEVQALDKIGALSHPFVLSGLAKIGEAFTDSHGMIGGNAGASPEGAAAAAEANDIIRNKDNPKFAAYHKGDPEVSAYVEQLMKKGYPGTVEI